MAITDNGQYVYVGFAGSSTARRHNVAEQTAGLQFPPGSDPVTGALYAEDIEALPGKPGSVAISRMNNGFSPRHEGVAIYDDGIARPMTSQDHTGSNKIEFNSANSLLGYNNETTEFGLCRLSVSAGGVNEVAVSQNIISGFYVDFIYHDNHVYATNGTVVNVAAAPYVAGYFNGGFGPVVYDSYNNLVCYVSTDVSGVITFKRFNPNTFLLHDAVLINQAFGFAYSLVTCGNDCHAFNTADNKVVILDKVSTFTKEPGLPNNRLGVYPNPAAGYFSIADGSSKAKSILVSGMDGKTIKEFVARPENKYDVGSLDKGMYIITVFDDNGLIGLGKLVK